MTNAKPKIAILGAGPAGLSTALWLTDPSNPRSRDFDITLYQLGWRIGGKGASGRNLAEHDRIEEHGIHLFGNWYVNTWSTVRSCYEHLFGDDWESLMDRHFIGNDTDTPTEIGAGGWERFLLRWPSSSHARPWDGIGGVLDQIERLIDLLVETGKRWEHLPSDCTEHLRDTPTRRDPTAADELRAWASGQHAAGELDENPDEDYLGWAQARVTANARAIDFFRKKFVSNFFEDVILTLIVALVLDPDLRRDSTRIDHLEYLDFLAAWSAAADTLESRHVRMVPNMCFQFPRGDWSKKPSMSARAFVQFMTRGFTRAPALAWFFRAGTGESVLLPAYRTLLQRGVSFELLHRVLDVVPDGDTIDRIELQVDAAARAGTFDPLRPIEGRTGVFGSTWYTDTPYDLLRDGERLRAAGTDLESWWPSWPAGYVPERRTLRRGEEDGFDFAVLAIPIGAHRYSCPSLVDAAWTAMVDALPTIPTQAAQIWLKPDNAGLGLCEPPDMGPRARFSGTTWTDPMSSWVDYGDMLAEEETGYGPDVRSLLYFCGPLSETGGEPTPDADPELARQYVAAQEATVANGFDAMLDSEAGYLLPGIRLAHGIDRSQIADVYTRANVEPSERYVLAAPGSTAPRRKAWESGYRNLALAGDWIETGLNIGSFEAAVTSGMLASHALTHWPKLGDIADYDWMQAGNSTTGPPHPLIP